MIHASPPKLNAYCESTRHIYRRLSNNMPTHRKGVGEKRNRPMSAPKLVQVEDRDTTLRSELRILIQERDLVKSRRDKTQDAVERGQKFVAQLEANLAKFDDVGERVAQERGRAFRQSLINGETLPMPSLSKELSAASAQRLDAENQLSGGTQALEALTMELDNENRELSVLESDVLTVAKKVCANHGDVLADTLRRMEREAGELRRRLLGLTQMRSPNIGAYPLGAQAVSLLRDIGVNSMATHTSGEDVQFWDEWLHRLRVDADARPEES
jgi:chromosome segregation ATPase